MCLKSDTPCDYGECPYNAQYHNDCEYWCGAGSDEDYIPEDEDYIPEELVFEVYGM